MQSSNQGLSLLFPNHPIPFKVQQKIYRRHQYQFFLFRILGTLAFVTVVGLWKFASGLRFISNVLEFDLQDHLLDVGK